MSERPSLQELGAAYAEGLEFQEREVGNLVRELEEARQEIVRLKAALEKTLTNPEVHQWIFEPASCYARGRNECPQLG